MKSIPRPKPQLAKRRFAAFLSAFFNVSINRKDLNEYKKRGTV
jgi:hypothetical protein